MMFEFIRNHTRILFFILLILIIPSFLLFGIEGYLRDGDAQQIVAKVGNVKISQAQLDAEHQNTIDTARRQMPGMDVKLLDTPEMKQRTLDGLLREEVLRQAAQQKHLRVSDQRLQRIFTTDPQFASLRNSDGSVNKDFLMAQGMSSAQFEQRLRDDIAQRQVLQSLVASSLATSTQVNAGFNALLQQREVQVLRFEPQTYQAQVKPTDADLQAYYKNPANAQQFKSSEQADIEYVVLDLAAVAKTVTLSEDDLKKYYEQNKARYTAAEERRASHILIKADAAASAQDKAKAKALAQTLWAQVKAAPNTFEEVAKKHSQDASAQSGGDLDFFGRGMMVKPFEDAAFGLKVGEITPVVETEFGYHIIKVTAQRGGETKSFADVRKEIETEIGQQQAQRKFAELSSDFNNLVFEQADALKPVADRFKLELRTAQGIPRSPAPGSTGALANPKFLQALFSADSLEKKRNTDAIDLGGNQLVAGRIVKYVPAQVQPFEQVRDKVRAAVTLQQAAALAHKDAKARLVALKAAPKAPLNQPVQVISRAQPKGLPPAALTAALQAPVQSLPTWVPVDLGSQGHLLIKVNKILGRDPAAGDAAQTSTQFTQALAEAEALAYYDALKADLKVKILKPITKDSQE
jgi:peptidyl-prolyl cis-trans isomerase D